MLFQNFFFGWTKSRNFFVAVQRKMAAKRLAKELTNMHKNPPKGIVLEPSGPNESLMQWRAVIDDPDHSPYAGGKFVLQLDIPADYPMKPPVVKFITPVYHCNVVQTTGRICLDLLHSPPGGVWSPALTLVNLCMSIQSLLTDPNAASPLEGKIAHLFLTNRKLHDENARNATLQFATPQLVINSSSTVAAAAAAVGSA